MSQKPTKTCPLISEIILQLQAEQLRDDQDGVVLIDEREDDPETYDVVDYMRWRTPKNVRNFWRDFDQFGNAISGILG